MSSSGPSPWATVAAVAAVIACCALIPAIVLGAGVAAAVAGAAVRYWPLTLVGIVVLVWSGVAIARVLRRRREALPRHGEARSRAAGGRR